MCLVALAIGQHPRFPLVLAANRDEFFDRPADPLGWWRPGADRAPVLSGRDRTGGGTWLGLSAAGRMALLTNVREPGREHAHAPSRGTIALDWLEGRESIDAFVARIGALGYNGFNLIAVDGVNGSCFWANNREPRHRFLSAGVYGLSNDRLDTPWPKVVALKSRTTEALSESSSTDALSTRLFAALADPTPAADQDLPSTGIPREREKQLSSAFIRIVGRHALAGAGLGRDYGTRCATVLVSERIGDTTETLVTERRFEPDGGIEGQTIVRLIDWSGVNVAPLQARAPAD